jgi:hypothetical protein
MNVKPESNEAQRSAPDGQLGNGYEYDCEPREYSDAAKKQWYEGLPEFLEKRIAERGQAKAE